MTKNPKPVPILSGRNTKLPSGITLIELSIATFLLVLVIFAGSGIYLSGWNIFRDAQYISQASRNAMVPMAHMVKRLQLATSFTSVAGPLQQLQFTINPSGTPSTQRYIFNRDRNGDGTGDNIIEYDNNITAGGEQLIGSHIIYTGTNPTLFTISHGGIVANITITAEDNRGQGLNLYTIRSSVEGRYGATPPVITP